MMKRHLPKSNQHDYKMVKQYFFSTVKLDYKAMLGEPFFFLLFDHLSHATSLWNYKYNDKQKAYFLYYNKTFLWTFGLGAN